MPRRAASTIALAVALALAACGGGGDGRQAASSTTQAPGSGAESTRGYSASIATYEQVANRAGRFIVGLTGPEGRLVSFGTVKLRFSYLGNRTAPVREPVDGPAIDGRFIPVAGQRLRDDEPGPRLARPSEGVGVYGGPVTFDRPGFWQVSAEATIDGKPVRAVGPFEVAAAPQLPFPGDPAPRTRNAVWGTPGVAPEVIDSRAEEGKPDPAPALHSTVIADALDAGRPLMVVISTPVYCQSRFCGPITDTVAELATRFGERMSFVHLEVFKDFERGVVNAAAAEWIKPRDGGELREPWTYVVGSDGRITDRFDNVASTDELEAAVQRVLQG